MSKGILFSLVVTSFALFSYGEIPAVTPSDDNYSYPEQKLRLEKQMDQAKKGGGKVVFIGDSITHYWEYREGQEGCGQEQLKKYFSRGDLKMFNLGMMADTTANVLWRIRKRGVLDGYEAKVIFLLIGTNNSGYIKDYVPADTILGIREILNVIREKQPNAKIVLTAILPRGDMERAPVAHERNVVINGEIAKFADDKNIFWLDFTERFIKVDGKLATDLFPTDPNLLHPGPQGYEIWASAALPYANAALAGQPLPPSRRSSKGTKIVGPLATNSVSRIRGEGPLGWPYVFDWWTDRLFMKRDEIHSSSKQFDLVFFGDSITYNWEDNRAVTKELAPGMDAFAGLRKTYSILNIGYPGDRTENLIWRGLNGELDGFTAKCIMLLVGTNNSNPALRPNSQMDKPKDIAAGIKRILDIIADRQPTAKVLLVPIFPCSDADARKNNEAVNEIIRTYANGDRVIWFDPPYKALRNEDGSPNGYITTRGGDDAYAGGDGTHPNKKFYDDVWAPAVRKAAREIIGK